MSSEKRINEGFAEVSQAFSLASSITVESEDLNPEQRFLANSTLARMILDRADIIETIKNIEKQQEIEKLNAIYGRKEDQVE